MLTSPVHPPIIPVLAVGNERWFKALDNKYAKEIKNTKERIYQVKGKDAGRVISAGEGAGNFTFIEIFDAGHMVPDFSDYYLTAHSLTECFLLLLLSPSSRSRPTSPSWLSICSIDSSRTSDSR